MNWEAKYLKLKKEFDDFAYIVSHDLRAPLRAISNLSDWIQDDLGEHSNEDVTTNFNLLKERTAKLDTMIIALLEYSRVGRMNLEIEQIDLSNMVPLMVEEFKEKKIRIEMAGTLPAFETYKHKITTVFKYLISNAVNFNHQSETIIHVRGEDAGDFYQFTIEDNGPGIPADKRDMAFTMFRSLQPADQQKSIGVGLTMVSRIIDFVGGSIVMEDGASGGTKITFTWPKKIIS